MALYRKYRPATFAEVVGQEQVTEPLSVALDTGRINHAYLFSGPRGCGKTSSARILARSLNCVQGPTSTPCGECNSCVSLAPGGPGNLDVTEMDAASHRGVEDMRALRDRAIYAPAESRYRVFIIDEAHMITNEGFNALLKIVEEPPAHLIFIFATTEPDKVIQTIRSRTHHYPFRLLTPQAMRQLISSVAQEEEARVEESVYPLLIQAGGGSPRDTLSIFDQLLAGSGPEGLTYAKAVPLLGITDDSLIDASVNALASADAAALFNTIDDVVEAGNDPRRFAMDLLDRLRDLMIVSAVPDAFAQGLVVVPAGREEVFRTQAEQLSTSQLARLAQTVNDGIGDLRGATSSRLLLEVLFGHLLVETQAAPATTPAPTQQLAQTGESTPERWARQHREREKEAAPAPQPEARPTPAPKPTPEPEPAPEPQEAPADLAAQIRSLWGKIRKDIMARNRTAGIMLAQAEVLGVREDTLVLGHTTGALAERLNDPSNNNDIVAVVADHAGRQLKVQCVVGTDAQAAGVTQPPAQRTWKPARQTEPDEAPEEVERPVAPPTPQPKPQPKPEPQPQPKTATWQEKVAEARQNAAERARNAPTFDDGVPLPPEPEPEPKPPETEFEPEPEPAAPEPEPADEERMMAEEAEVPGEKDTRSSLEVAAELLSQELGARPV